MIFAYAPSWSRFHGDDVRSVKHSGFILILAKVLILLLLLLLLLFLFFFFLLLAPGAWIALLIQSVSVSYCLYCIFAALSSFLTPPPPSLSLSPSLSVCLSVSLSLSLSLPLSLLSLSLSLSLSFFLFESTVNSVWLWQSWNVLVPLWVLCSLNIGLSLSFCREIWLHVLQQLLLFCIHLHTADFFRFGKGSN